jgi:hypothetical protein
VVGVLLKGPLWVRATAVAVYLGILVLVPVLIIPAFGWQLPPLIRQNGKILMLIVAVLYWTPVLAWMNIRYRDRRPTSPAARWRPMGEEPKPEPLPSRRIRPPAPIQRPSR